MMSDKVKKHRHVRKISYHCCISKLPQYIVNCFITTGYDNLEVIREINEQKLNDIEEFINKHFPKNDKYIHPDFDTCMFPPGHRTRMCYYNAIRKT